MPTSKCKNRFAKISLHTPRMLLKVDSRYFGFINDVFGVFGVKVIDDKYNAPTPEKIRTNHQQNQRVCIYIYKSVGRSAISGRDGA